MEQKNPQASGENANDSSAPKILIVDEDIRDLSFHAIPFDAQGFKVYKCSSYETALRAVEKEDFDLAIVDQGSEAFEGGRVLRHLRRFSPETPFVVLARIGDMKCYVFAIEMGAVEYLEKPVSASDMNRMIHDFLRVPLKAA
jgi:DNA-binding NtrC family response regulator